MAGNPAESPYGLDEDLEQGMIALCCDDPTAFEQIGAHLNPDLLGSPDARLLLRAARAVYDDVGRGPTNYLTVVQRIRTWHTSGSVALEAFESAVDYLFEADDVDAAEVVAEVTPILRRRAHAGIVRAVHDVYASNGDFTEIGHKISEAESIGKTDVGTGVWIGPGAWAAIAQVRNMQRLPFGIPPLDAVLHGGLPQSTVGMFIGSTGEGKCHARDTEILMHDGTVKMVQDVAVGDVLMGADGGPRRVLSVNTGRGLMYDVIPGKGEPWRVNDRHILTLVDTVTNGVEDVELRDWLVRPQTRRRRSKLFRVGVEAFAGEASFDDLPLDPYLLGVLLGDGEIAYNCTISNSDPEVARRLGEIAEEMGVELRVVERESGATLSMVGRGGLVRKRLRSLGLWGRQSGDKFIPHVYKTADRRARLALLAGLMDTDGSVSRTSYDFVTKSRRLAEDVAFVARSLGLCVPRVNERTAVCCNSPTRAVGTYYRLCISGETTVVPCLVPRKLPPMRTSKKDPLRTGFFVRRAGVQRYYGFTLDGDGRFLLGDFTVTHNSMCLSHAAATASYLGFSVAYATLELEVHEVWSRLIANMTGISINAVKDGSGEEVARQRMEVLSQRPLGPIVVKWFPGNLTTFGEIEVWVKKVKQEMQAAGRDLHLVCLDYVDRVKGAGDYAAAGEVMDAFRSKLVVQNSLWGLTASAAKAKEKHKRRKDEESGADSQNKSRVADTVITLNREEEEGVDDEFVEKAITYFVGKHRQGDARMSVGPLPTEMDVGRMCAVFREEGW